MIMFNLRKSKIKIYFKMTNLLNKWQVTVARKVPIQVLKVTQVITKGTQIVHKRVTNQINLNGLTKRILGYKHNKLNYLQESL